LWEAVYDWATNDARGANKYTFANAGRQGGDTGSGPVGTDQHPVTTISWRDAVVWCNAYSEAAGKRPVYNYGGAVLRESEGSGTSAGNGKAEKAVINASANGFLLPTEAEWEYAARGGVPSTTTPWTYTYPGTSDQNSLREYAWYSSNTYDVTNPVRQKIANTAGLYDMSGNVREYCWDIHSGTDRVTRGGCFGNDVARNTVAFRFNFSPDDSRFTNGFRVVRSGN
jgi:formylglycine-generating enzyme required for sulfatase activity